MSEQALEFVTATPAIEATEAVEDTNVTIPRPDLRRDAAGLLTLLFLIITYHIQNPFLLFRVPFGEGFRDVQEQGLQEAMLMALFFSSLLLIGSWRQLWEGRHESAGRLRLVIVLGGLALYALHMFFVIYRDTNVFTKIYDIDPVVFADELQMSRSQARELAGPMKALHGMALLGGIGLASTIYLWAPWESIRRYIKPSNMALQWVILKDIAAIALLILGIISYHLLNPLWLRESSLAENFAEQKSLVGLLLFLAAGVLVAVQRDLWVGDTTRWLRLALTIGIGFYVLNFLAATWGDFNFIDEYYQVEASVYNAQVLSEPARIKPLEAADRAAILAGVALISLVYLWSPWERLRLYRQVIWRNLAAIATAILVVVGWEVAVNVFEIEQFLLPKPSVIWDTFKEIYPALIAGSWYTFKNALRGFAVGCGAGIITGILSARFTRFSKAILPLAIAANAVPIIAFAPIANAWFGFINPDSRVAIVAVLCYFPAMISTVRGLTSVEPIQIELMRSYAASELQIFRHVRLPNALPFIFSALKLATTLAMIGAIVAEYFGGVPTTALGFKIKNDAALLKMTESWSAIIIASLLGIGFYMVVSMMERTAMPWYRSFRNDSR